MRRTSCNRREDYHQSSFARAQVYFGKFTASVTWPHKVALGDDRQSGQVRRRNSSRFWITLTVILQSLKITETQNLAFRSRSCQSVSWQWIPIIICKNIPREDRRIRWRRI